MKLALGMIVFNGMPFLEGVLETWYPHVEQIVVAEGPVKFWFDQGYNCSTDGTIECLKNFPDPENKLITRLRSTWEDKLDMCNAWLSLLQDDITHVACMDADEFMLERDILQVKRAIERSGADTVGLRLRSFVGGFDHYISGFELKQDTIRFIRRRPGARFTTHRPPTLEPNGGYHLGCDYLEREYGIYLYHYSHILPSQVLAKEAYYADYVGERNVIPNYYKELWLPWVEGDWEKKLTLENAWHGIHDFAPSYRGAAYSREFEGKHPKWITQNKERILQLQKEQIEWLRENGTSSYL